MFRVIKARLMMSIALGAVIAAGTIGALFATGHPTLLSSPTGLSHYHTCHKHCP